MKPLARGKYNVFVSNIKGERLTKTEGTFEEDEFKLFTTKLTIDRSSTYQNMLGIGASFTDSALVNIASLPPNLQEYLMKSMWSEDGAEYSIGRVAIGGSDFSLRGYTYHDDINGSFSLQPEDFQYKVSK